MSPIDILIRLHEPTERGRLYFYRDPQIENNIIFIQNNIRRQQAYSVNISSLIILGMDNDHMLKSVEIIYPQRKWIIEPTPTKIKSSTSADIEIADFSDKNIYFEIPVAVKTDNQKSYAKVLISSVDNGAEWIALSTSCFAMIQGSFLQGFFISFTQSSHESIPAFKDEQRNGI